MSRAEAPWEGRADGSSRVLSSAGSFRSAASYASFRSCNSFKSTDALSRASFKSVASRGTSYHSAASRFLNRSVSDGGPAELLEGVDNLSFFSFEAAESVLGSLPPAPGSLPPTPGPPELAGPPPPRPLGPALGSILLLLAAGLHAAAAALPQLLAPGVENWLLLLARALLQLLLSLPLLLQARAPPLGPPGARWRLLLLALLSGALLLAAQTALARLPAPAAAALLGLGPVTTALLALPLAREHTGLFRLLTCGLFLSGLLLHTRPTPLFPGPHPAPDGAGLAAGLAAPLLAALLLLQARQCRATLPTALLLLWTALGLTLVSTIGLATQTEDLAAAVALGPPGWLSVCLVASLGSLATLLLLQALAWVPAGRAALLAGSSLLVSYTLELGLAGTAPAWPGLLGAACLLLAALCAGLEPLMVDPGRWRWL